MILLRSLALRNFRIHKSLDLKFQKGVNGIIGGNGKGKSSIIEAILFLYTGICEDTKEAMISVGSASGYVFGTFELNGQEGYLERHLDGSKVLLKYDDKTYKKASEVKEVWANLLQINNEIFERLVIAKQGEIPLLFVGDKAIRSSIFQKIFLVPQVGKLRDLIWEEYIKKLPPELMVENLDVLQTELKEANQVYAGMLEEYTKYEPYTLSGIGAYDLKIHELQEKKRKNARREEIVKKAEDVNAQISKLELELLEQNNILAATPVSKEQVQVMLNESSNAKNQLAKKIQLQNTVKGIENKLIGLLWSEAKAEELKNKEQLCKEKELERNNILGSISRINEEISKHANFKGKSSCPTCGQSIADTTELLKNYAQKKSDLQVDWQAVDMEIKELSPRITTLRKDEQQYRELNQSLALYNKELLEYKDAVYDEENHKLLQQVLDKIVGTNTKVYAISSNLSILKTNVEKLREEYRQLVIPETTVQLDSELIQVTKDKTLYCALVEKANTLNVQVQVKKNSISNITSRLNSSQINAEKNKKREDVYKILMSLYDLFHPTYFSKKVIQRYASVVTDYLHENLVKFNIPYYVSVNDEFNIDVYTREGFKLPRVSGGQQQIVGICLRLALIQLFAQSFSFMVIDEGTTGLHVDNQQAYFELIRDLSNSQLQQVIVVDHNEKLNQYVDNFICLN